MDLPELIDGHAKAVHVTSAGSDALELVGNFFGRRSRLPTAFGLVPEKGREDVQSRERASPHNAVIDVTPARA